MRSFRRLLDAGRRAAAAFATRQDGGPSVEFVLVAPVFIVVIFATVQCAIIYFCNAGLETVTEEAARLVLTNQSTSLSAAQFQTAVCNKLPTFFTCSGIKVGLQAAPSNCSISTARAGVQRRRHLGRQPALPATVARPDRRAASDVSVAGDRPAARLEFRQSRQRHLSDDVHSGLHGRTSAMTNARASAAQILRRAARAARALRDDARATAAVEAALILPIALTMFALLIYGAEAFAIQRKVTLTARTVTDLVTQAAPTQMSSGASVVVHATIDNLCRRFQGGGPALQLATIMSMVVSQVKVNSDGATRPTDHRLGDVERALQRRNRARAQPEDHPADRPRRRPGGQLSRPRRGLLQLHAAQPVYAGRRR